MSAEKLLARLNAKNARFDVGSGGIAEIEVKDIAMALASVPQGLGRELLCAVYWPDGAALSQRQVADLVWDEMLKEWNRREEARNRFLLKEMMRKIPRQGVAPDPFAQADGDRWPPLLLKGESFRYNMPYLEIPQAVVRELCGGHRCSICAGRGNVHTGGRITTCTSCKGTGNRRPTDTMRAMQCGLADHTNYVRNWRRVYEWVYQECCDRLTSAVRDFRRAFE